MEIRQLKVSAKQEMQAIKNRLSGGTKGHQFFFLESNSTSKGLSSYRLQITEH